MAVSPLFYRQIFPAAIDQIAVWTCLPCPEPTPELRAEASIKVVSGNSGWRDHIPSGIEEALKNHSDQCSDPYKKRKK